MRISERSWVIVITTALAGCGQARVSAASDPVPRAAPAGEAVLSAGAEGGSETTNDPPPTAPAVVRVVPSNVEVRVAPGEPRLVLGTDMTLRVRAPVRDETTGAWSAHVEAHAGAEVLNAFIACDTPTSFRGVALTVHSSLSRDGLVGYTLDTGAPPYPQPECASDADCTLSTFACCGVACGPLAAHVDVLAASMDLCERRVCGAQPALPCPDEPPPIRAACIGGLCATVR